MAQASLLACEGLAGVSLVPTAASKKMMLSQIASKQAENGERAGSPDVLRCSSQGHRKDSDKSRSRKDDDNLAEASHPKKTVKKAGNGVTPNLALLGNGVILLIFPLGSTRSFLS